MSTKDDIDRKAPRREHGPQGTHVFSREEVGRLIDEATPSDARSSSAQLKGVSVEVKGSTFALKGERLVLGRASSCDITLGDSSISSEHARLNREADGWRVVNLLSTNGTFVNDQRVSNEVLKHGDRLRLGRIEFVFQDPDRPVGQAAGENRSSGQHAWLPWTVAAGVLMVAAVVAVVVLGVGR